MIGKVWTIHETSIDSINQLKNRLVLKGYIYLFLKISSFFFYRKLGRFIQVFKVLRASFHIEYHLICLVDQNVCISASPQKWIPGSKTNMFNGYWLNPSPPVFRRTHGCNKHIKQQMCFQQNYAYEDVKTYYLSVYTPYCHSEIVWVETHKFYPSLYYNDHECYGLLLTANHLWQSAIKKEIA